MKDKSYEQAPTTPHPLKAKILHLLSHKAMTLSQVAQELTMNPANLAYYFRILKNAKLIQLVEERDLGRNVEKYYLAVPLPPH